MPESTYSPSSMGTSSPSSSLGSAPREGQAKDLVNRATESAHGAVDRLAEKAAPAVQKLEAGVAQANEALHERARRAREMGGEWTDSMRHTVREHPLTSVALALAAGAVIARIARDHR